MNKKIKTKGDDKIWEKELGRELKRKLRKIEKIRDRFGFEIDETKFKGIMTELKLKPKRRQKQ